MNENPDPEIDDEIEFHLAMRAKELVEEGLSPEAAEVEARNRFGDRERIRYECRRIRQRGDEHVRRSSAFEQLRQDLRYGLRQLAANRGFASIAIATLALGIGATTSVFSVLQAVVLRPLAFEEPERIALVGENWQELGPTSVAVGHFVDWRRASSDLFEHLASLDHENFNLSDGSEPERVLGAQVSRGFFELLGMPPLIGRWPHEEEDRLGGDKVVVLAHGLWSRRFGADPSILGREISLNGVPHTVVGVMPEAFSYPADDQELWVPAQFTPEEEREHDEHFLSVFGRLRPGISYQAAQARMDAIAVDQERLYPRETSGIRVVPYVEWLTGDYRERLLVMMGAVGLVLLIACINVANLLLARGAVRGREMAIRAALGAGAGRLARQVLVETLLLALLGALVGTALSLWLTESLIASAPGGVPRIEETRVDPAVLAFTLAAAAMASLLSGLLPAFAAARAEIPALRGEHRAGASRSSGRIRFALVASQIALALTLLAGAGLLVRSAFEMGRVSPGFDPTNVLTARLTLAPEAYPEPERVLGWFERIVAEASGLPGVRHAAVASQVPMGPGGGSNGLIPEGKTFEELIDARFRMVTPDYFAAMGIPLLEGRLFEPSDRREGALVMVLSETLARVAFPGQSALGKRIRCCEGGPDDRSWKVVVGVVGDVRSRGLGARIEPEFYLPIAQAPPAAWDWVERTVTLAVKTEGDPEAIVPSLRAMVHEVDPAVPLHGVASMEQRIADSLAQPRFLASLLLVTSLLGLVLAAVGVYGVIGYLAARRSHEIGVRMALGARSSDVLRMMLRQAMSPIALGLAAGLLAARAGASLLESQLFGVRATDPYTFATAAVVLAAVGFGASYLPARRIARADPKRALHQG